MPIFAVRYIRFHVPFFLSLHFWYLKNLFKKVIWGTFYSFLGSIVCEQTYVGLPFRLCVEQGVCAAVCGGGHVPLWWLPVLQQWCGGWGCWTGWAQLLHMITLIKSWNTNYFVYSLCFVRLHGQCLEESMFRRVLSWPCYSNITISLFRFVSQLS